MPLPRNNILLVDDQSDYRVILRHMLGRIYEVAEAATLKEGLAFLKQHEANLKAADSHKDLHDNESPCGPVYCMILDLNLPDSLPIHTVHHARGAATDLPIVVVSGDSNPITIAESIWAGADAYWIKGRDDIDVEAMVRSISAAVRQRLILQRLDELRGHTEQLRRDLNPNARPSLRAL